MIDTYYCYCNRILLNIPVYLTGLRMGVLLQAFFWPWQGARRAISARRRRRYSILVGSRSWTPSKVAQADSLRLPDSRGKSGVGLRRVLIQPLDVCVGHRLEILKTARILIRLAHVWDQLPHSHPDKQQLHAALEEQLLIQDPAADERRHHLPIAHHHPGIGIHRRARRAPPVELLHRAIFEVLREPFPAGAHFFLPARLVKA